jgi:Flp pilus assembly protein TadG
MRFFNSILSDFKRDERGQLAVILAGAIIPIGFLLGASHDFGRAFNSREQLQ